MRAQVIGNGFLKARIPAPFAAAMQALQLPGTADTKILRLLSDKEWRELLSKMDFAHLTLPFAQLELTGLPCWVRERLGNNLADTARHWGRVQTAYREAAATLDANCMEYLVMKGFTQAPDFAPRPELRWQGDIDFYMPRHHIPAAVRALQGIGYTSCQAEEYYQYADHVPTLVRFGTWKWSGNRYDPDVPPAVEVHFCLWNESISSIGIREIDEFWYRRRFCKLGDLTFPALHPVDHVGYFALHILREIFCAESAAHHVRELATFLHRRALDDSFWREWKAMHSPRLRSMETIAFSLAVRWFSCNHHHALKEAIESLDPALRSWVETCGNAPLETLFRRTREGRLLQSLLAETPESRRRIIAMALSPGRIAGPAKVASVEIHPTATPAQSNWIDRYLAYPAYLVSRVWLNGSAIFRFIAHASLLYFVRVWQRPGWSQAIEDTSGD